MTKAYKLLRLRKDGSVGPLFIHRKLRVPTGIWLPAEAHRTRGYSFRPGWHVTLRPYAPHLSMKGRVWCEVEVKDYVEIKRPAAQGGIWLLANQMKLVKVMEG